MENKNIPVSGHILDNYFLSKEKLSNSEHEEVRAIANDFKSMDFTALQHRVAMAIAGKYDEEGYNEQTFRKGIILTPYELCKRIGCKQDKIGRFGYKTVKEASGALLSLSRITFTMYFLRFEKRVKGKNLYSVFFNPSCTLIEIVKEASNVTEEDLRTGKLEEKVSRIHIRINPNLLNVSYYRLIETNFYQRLKEVLDKYGRRVSKYHWNFLLWCMKQRHRRKQIEINVDKLAGALKIPMDRFHRTRARGMVRRIYEDFRILGYISGYTIDVQAQNGKTKDVILFTGKLG